MSVQSCLPESEPSPLSSSHPAYEYMEMGQSTLPMLPASAFLDCFGFKDGIFPDNCLIRPCNFLIRPYIICNSPVCTSFEDQCSYIPWGPFGNSQWHLRIRDNYLVVFWRFPRPPIPEYCIFRLSLFPDLC